MTTMAAIIIQYVIGFMLAFIAFKSYKMKGLNWILFIFGLISWCLIFLSTLQLIFNRY
jgi:hypothetical protein